MASSKAWLALLTFYIFYLLLGGFAFQQLEGPEECVQIQLRNEKISEIIRHLKEKEITDEDVQELSKLIYDKIEDFNVNRNCGSNSNESELNCGTKWDFYNSFIFTFTASTTIGYGQLAPATDNGKLLCIFYSLIGIPINGILIGSLGTYFASKIRNIRKNNSPRTTATEKYLSIFFDVLIYLIPGIMIFMLAPAFVFKVVEQWNYFDSFYFTYVTLTTIGFGDFAAGRNDELLKNIGYWRLPYEIFIVVWIIFGLGYLFMIITFISEGIQRPVRKAVKKFAAADINFMSQIISELFVMKRKEKMAIKCESDSMTPKFESVEKIDLRRAISLHEILSEIEHSSPIFENGTEDKRQDDEDLSDSCCPSLERRKAGSSGSSSNDFINSFSKRSSLHLKNNNSPGYFRMISDESLSTNEVSELFKTTTLHEFLIAARKVENNEEDSFCSKKYGTMDMEAGDCDKSKNRIRKLGKNQLEPLNELENVINNNEDSENEFFPS